jgi:hypothetical protein
VLFWSSFIAHAPCSRCENSWSFPLLFGSTTLESKFSLPPTSLCLL